MAHYIVNWFLNGYPLPVLNNAFEQELLEKGKCTPEDCPNSFVTQKGPKPSRALLTIPFGSMDDILDNVTQGQHELEIVWQHSGTEPSNALELPELSIRNSERILIDKLYVTHVSEVLKFKDILQEEDLVIVELQDARYLFQEYTDYDKAPIPNTRFNPEKTVASILYDNRFKSLYDSSLNLDTTNEFFPEREAGWLDHLTQFSVNTFKEDWESFNECCNRTENSFFIDLDGTPVIQKNSHWIANPLNTTSEGKPIDFFLGDSAFSETLGYDTNVNDQNEKWYEIKASYWTTQSKSFFWKLQKDFDEGSGTPHSTLNIFPLTISNNTHEGKLQNLLTYYRDTLDAYIAEIKSSRDIEHTRIKHNGVVKVNFKSQISTLRYTNNPSGVFTYIDVKFRHGIPFYKFDGKFKDEFVPTLHADMNALVYPRNLGHVYHEGFNQHGWHQHQNSSGMFGPQNHRLRGFYGSTTKELNYSYGKTNCPKTFNMVSGSIKTVKSGYYKVALWGDATIYSAGVVPQGATSFHGPMLFAQDAIEPGESKWVEGIFEASFPTDIKVSFKDIRSGDLSVISVGDSEELNNTISSALTITEGPLIQAAAIDQATGIHTYKIKVKVSYAKTVYHPREDDDTKNCLGGTIMQGPVSFSLMATMTNTLPTFCREANFLLSREKIVIHQGLANDSNRNFLGQIRFPDSQRAGPFRVDRSSAWYDPLDTPAGAPNAHLPWNNYLSGFQESHDIFENSMINELGFSNKLEITTADSVKFNSKFHFEKIIRFNAGQDVTLSITPTSKGGTVGNILASFGEGTESTVISPLNLTGQISLTFVSENEPINQTIEL